MPKICKGKSVESIEQQGESEQCTKAYPIPLGFSKDATVLENSNSQGCSILNL